MTPSAEFNIHHDPEAARQVLSSPEPKTLIPLEAAERVSLTFAEFEQVCGGSSAGAQFLRRLLPHAFRAHHQVLGFEGLPLRELLGVAAIARPFLFQSRRLPVDVETHGELTRGQTVCDRRSRPANEGEGAGRSSWKRLTRRGSWLIWPKCLARRRRSERSLVSNPTRPQERAAKRRSRLAFFVMGSSRSCVTER